MNTIILSPPLKKIEHVIHVSDIHIRTGDLERSRYTEYEEVFKEFIESISKLENLEESVLVITGDIFHHKGKIEPFGIKLSQFLLTSLLEYIDVCMICGNHDYRQDSPDTPDMIETIYENYIHQNVKTKHRAFYLNNTGYYDYNNIRFSVVSVKDTLKKYNTVGRNENIDDFPPRIDSENIDYSIALFHGTIFYNSYQLDWFKGYEYAMLGDNHTMQWSIDENGLMWGYPGSLIQQDFGERFLEHGYFIWKLKEKRMTFAKVFNNYGYCSVKEIKGKLFAYVKKNTWFELCSIDKFPEHISFRVFSNDIIPKLVEFCKSKNITPLSITQWEELKETISNNNNNINRETDLEELNTTNKWFEYLEKFDDIEKYKDFINHPELLKLTETSDIVKNYKERNEKIQKAIDEYTNETTKVPHAIQRVELLDMKWSYLMCYGENNHFNFEEIESEIALLNGKNAIGKSSFLDVICIALYGEPTKMRNLVNGKKYTDKIIHDRRPSNKTAPSVKLQFKKNDCRYEIFRSFGVQSSKIKEHAILQTKVQLYAFMDGDTKTIICEGSTLVDKWIEEHIGNIGDILMSIMICQTDLNNFFHLKQDDQKIILDKALRIHTVSLYGKILRESVLAHVDILNQLKTAKQTILDIFPKNTQRTHIDTREKEQWREEIIKNITKIIKEEDIVVNIEFLFNEITIVYIQENLREQLSSDDNEKMIVFREKLLLIKKQLEDLVEIEDDDVLCEKWKKKYDVFLTKEPKCEVSMEWIQRTLQNYKSWLEKSDIDCGDYPTVEKKLFDFVKIEQPLKKPTFHPQSCPITEKEYTDYKKAYLKMMDNRIVKNRTEAEYKEWNNRFKIFQENTRFDIQKAERRLKLYSSKIEKYNEKKQLEKELEELQDVEFNHECWACAKNPFSIKKTILLEKYKKNTDKSTETTFHKWKDILHDTKIEINNYNEAIKEKAVFEKEEIYWKDILDTWVKYDKWKLDSDRLLDDIQYYENYTYSQLWKKYKTQEETHSKLLEEYHSKKDRYTEKIEWDNLLSKIEKYKNIYELYEIWKAEHVVITDKLNSYKQSIQRRTLQKEYNICETEYLKYKNRADILANYEKFKNMFYSSKLHAVDKELKILFEQKSKHDAENEIIQKHQASLDRIQQYETLYEDRLTKIKALELLFIGDKISNDGYKEWIYKNQVIPLINTEMNTFLKMFENFTFEMTIEKKNFIYMIHDRECTVPLDKASGYQNFIISIAFRIILTRIGAVGQKLKHLFIDEGFTACDSVNIEKVPVLLKSILEYGSYKSIVLMSHLDSVRDCASINIHIERIEPFSYIR